MRCYMLWRALINAANSQAKNINRRPMPTIARPYNDYVWETLLDTMHSAKTGSVDEPQKPCGAVATGI